MSVAAFTLRSPHRAADRGVRGVLAIMCIGVGQGISVLSEAARDTLMET